MLRYHIDFFTHHGYEFKRFKNLNGIDSSHWQYLWKAKFVGRVFVKCFLSGLKPHGKHVATNYPLTETVEYAELYDGNIV
jgi:hypothetical protein